MSVLRNIKRKVSGDSVTDAANLLARHIANVQFDSIPADVVKVARMEVLDTLGVALAATTLAPGCPELVDLAMEGAGKEESTILGSGGKVPSWMAALANGTLAHSLGYDDFHESANVHPGVTVVPASLAVAEREGKVSGKEFLTAVVLGIDLSCRLSLAAPKSKGWDPTALCGYFGAAAAASKILGLKEGGIQNALGIAYSQAAGNTQASTDGALTRRMQAGFASMGGVLSALLAGKGITGAANSLEGEFGFYQVYHQGRYDQAALTSELGKRFEVSNLSFKPYPSPRGTHAAIDATLDLISEHGIRPQDVESITVFKSPGAVEHYVKSPEARPRAMNAMEAQHDIAFTVATAVLKRQVGLRDFLPEALQGHSVLQMCERVSVQPYPEFATFIPAIVEIRTREGKGYSKRVDEPSGGPKNPVSNERLIQKFADCASYSIISLSEERLKDVTEMTMNLEKIEDVGEIVSLLDPSHTTL